MPIPVGFFFSATAEPNHAPPRVRLDLNTGDSEIVFGEIEIRRNGQLIRAAVPTGSPLSVVYDYDCPFGETVTYTATGTIGGFTSVLEETWDDLSGWSTAFGTPAVAGGRLTSGAVERDDFALPSRIVIHDAATFKNSGDIRFRTLPEASAPAGGHLNITALDGYIEVFQIPSNDYIVTLPGTGDWSLTNTATGCRIESTAGSWDFGWKIGDLGETDLYLLAIATSTAFELFEGTTPEDFDVSDTAILNAPEAWLIHPIDPDLSVKVSTVAEGGRYDRVYVEGDSAKQVTHRAQREVFSPLGRTRQVVVTYGRRRQGEWSLVLRIPREEDRIAVLELLTDQSPILVRYPPSFPWDLEQGWYSVDDVDDDRLLDAPTKNIRSMTLPLLPVDEPVLIQGAQWTYGDDLVLNSTYQKSRTRFPTYLDRLIGPTS